MVFYLVTTNSYANDFGRCKLRFEVKEWKLIELYFKRNQINFPVYQRQEVWSVGQNKLLIDSIFRGIDIPKIYLQYLKNEKGYEQWDCIDGHQRIKAIIGYFDRNFDYEGYSFDKLSSEQKRSYEDYKLTIAEITEISPEEVRLLFKRLQLGIPLNSGEKLNAILSNMGEFVKSIKTHPFIQRLSIPDRRFAKEQVCAQICNNSSFINKTAEFRNSKYEDLENLYTTNKDFDLHSNAAISIEIVLDKLDGIFGVRAAEITNRASAISIYLFVEEFYINSNLSGKEQLIGSFYLEFLSTLREQVRLGIDATNRFLLQYQSRVIQAADSRTSISERHFRLKEAFDYYLANSTIIS